MKEEAANAEQQSKKTKIHLIKIHLSRNVIPRTELRFRLTVLPKISSKNFDLSRYNDSLKGQKPFETNLFKSRNNYAFLFKVNLRWQSK